MKIVKESLNIIIVDDEEVNIMLLEALLEKEHFKVKRSFTNPLKAEEYLLKNECDILLVDYNMPKMDGSTLITKIKMKNPDLITIMITADQTNRTMLKALEAGANDVLLKPISAVAFQLKFQNISQLAYSLKVTKQEKNSFAYQADFYQNAFKVNETLVKQYEDLINTSSAFIRIDKEFNIIDINDVYCDILEKERSQVVATSIFEYVEDEFQKEKVEDILQSLESYGTWNGIVPLNINGNLKYLDGSVHAIYNDAHELIEYMSANHEVTELINIQEEIKKTQADVVFTMGSIGETRSKETGNHVKRVAEYSKLLALFYGLDKEEAELLETASPMHDIGKVGIPDAILNKPGKLSDEEFIIMKTHANLGYQMLKHSQRPILKTAAIVAREHHEKWDGSGYPKGLSGKDIHIYGRITALADVFDALGSDRCYKKAWSDDKIFALLKEQRGKHFEPKLVDIFFDNLELFLDIRSRFADEIESSAS